MGARGGAGMNHVKMWTGKLSCLAEEKKKSSRKGKEFRNRKCGYNMMRVTYTVGQK